MIVPHQRYKQLKLLTYWDTNSYIVYLLSVYMRIKYLNNMVSSDTKKDSPMEGFHNFCDINFLSYCFKSKLIIKWVVFFLLAEIPHLTLCEWNLSWNLMPYLEMN